MRWTIAVLVLAGSLAAMTVGAEAQIGAQQSPMANAAGVGQHASQGAARGADNTPKVKANEKAYNAALRNLPDRQYDPWHGVR